MNLRYNYSFLPEFLRRNNISKRDLLDAVGTNDYTTLNRWLSCQSAVGTEMLLRLCNTFGIALSCFFVDMDAPQNMTIPIPTPDTQTEPEGGYSSNRRTTWNPAPLVKRQAVWPKPDATTETTAKEKELPVNEDIALLRMQAEYERKINKLNEEHAQRERELREECAERIRETKEKNRELVETLKAQVSFLQDMLKKDTRTAAKYATDSGLVSDFKM